MIKPCLIVTTILISSCVDFNTCSPTSGPAIGELATTFDVRKSTLRSQSCPVGNWIADALFWRAKQACETQTTRPCPDLAWINAGAIRAETACGSRSHLVKGPLHQADIDELLPFQNDLVVVQLSGRDIQQALEHAVEGKDTSRFLQVSGISFSTPGVQNLQLTSRKSNEAIVPEAKYHVAMSSYLANGNNGFVAFLLRDSHNRVILNSQNQPMTKLDPVTGPITTRDGRRVSVRDALLEWIAQQTLHNRPVAADLEPRIRY